jgi:hypothetical protein
VEKLLSMCASAIYRQKRSTNSRQRALLWLALALAVTHASP